jgi:hypothetical protein
MTVPEFDPTARAHDFIDLSTLPNTSAYQWHDDGMRNWTARLLDRYMTNMYDAKLALAHFWLHFVQTLIAEDICRNFGIKTCVPGETEMRSSLITRRLSMGIVGTCEIRNVDGVTTERYNWLFRPVNWLKAIYPRYVVEISAQLRAVSLPHTADLIYQGQPLGIRSHSPLSERVEPVFGFRFGTFITPLA